MSHTYTNLLAHVIFSTHNRDPLISNEIRSDLHAYIGGIIRELRGTAILIGGTSDHVHMLVRFPSDQRISDCLRVVKTNSSRWVHEKWPECHGFAWQTGYGAFSVSESQRDTVIRYIQNQQEHHRKASFQEEFIAFLRRQNITFDERYIWQ